MDGVLNNNNYESDILATRGLTWKNMLTGLYSGVYFYCLVTESLEILCCVTAVFSVAAES